MCLIDLALLFLFLFSVVLSAFYLILTLLVYCIVPGNNARCPPHPNVAAYTGVYDSFDHRYLGQFFQSLPHH